MLNALSYFNGLKLYQNKARIIVVKKLAFISMKVILRIIRAKILSFLADFDIASNKAIDAKINVATSKIHHEAFYSER